MSTRTFLKKKKNFTVLYLRGIFDSFPSTRRHEHQEFLDKYIIMQTLKLTVDDLWLQFCKYWHFINYDLLKFIIDKSKKASRACAGYQTV